MERILFRKIELWIVGLLAAVALAGLVVFGMLVRNQALGYDKFGFVGEIAFEIASIPATAQELFENKDVLQAYEGEKRFAGQQGWTQFDKEKLAGEDGYVLLSRFDGDRRQYVTQMFDLWTSEMVHEWVPDAEAVYAGVALDDSYGLARIQNEKYRIIHPLLLAGGDLLIKDHDTPMARINWCGDRVWTTKETFHHSTEMGPDQTVWMSGLNRPSQVPFREGDTHDDAMVEITLDGEVVSSFSVAKALLENGYEYLVTGMTFENDPDPLHLNDVQPVMEDGTYWKKGDLFVSIRHKSTVFQYRPSTGEIPWLRSGPWIFQHDVDILGDGKIGVFSNNMNPLVMWPENDRSNRVIVYDFATDSFSDLQRDALHSGEVRTVSEGLFTNLPKGHLLVEEENFGRLLILAPDGEVAAEFINGADNGIVYRLGWSRYIPRALGQKALAAGPGC